MPQPKLLRQPSRVLNSAQQEYLEKINSKLERPERKPKSNCLETSCCTECTKEWIGLGCGSRPDPRGTEDAAT